MVYIKYRIKIYLLSFFLFISGCATVTGTENLACKNLSKVTDIDSLLFQMYSNIDSNCLFEMPVEELEKIWGIKVLDSVGKNWNEIDKINQVYWELLDRDNIEIFVFRKYFNNENKNISFTIFPSIAYSNKNGYGGSVGQAKLPKNLPPPLTKFPDSRIQPHDQPLTPDLISYLEKLPKESEYRAYSTYYWMNRYHSKKLPILIMTTGSYKQVSLIHFYQKTPKFFNNLN